MVLGDLNSYMQKMKLDHQFKPYTINRRWIKDLNMSQHHKSPRGEHRQENLRYSTQQHFTDMSPRARDIKERINKWDFIKIKSFCTAKENISNMEREPTIWENIFANDAFDKGLISKINSPIRRWTMDLNRHFSKESIQRAQRHMKGFSASLPSERCKLKPQ